jgi:hypothetical protein
MMQAIARLTAGVVALPLLMAWFSAEAQRPHVTRIGIIQSGSQATSAGLVDSFSQRLRANSAMWRAGASQSRFATLTTSAKHRLPAIYGFREAVDAGGLMSFGPNQVIQ